MSDKRDRELGVDRPIDRRDFINGVAVGVASLSTGLAHASSPAQAAAPQDRLDYYPPTLTGLRGSHPGSFETAHSLRDGTFWDRAGRPEDDHSIYDLVIVGGGISGLSAAYFFRAAKPNARILILDNHDDFGGHAKRNEFHIGGRLQLLNGGTMLIDSPHPYSPVAAGLLKHLAVDPVALKKECYREEIYRGLAPATFFDKETFGADRLVVGRERSDERPGVISWEAFLAKAPLDARARTDILRVQEGAADPMPELTSAQKKDQLSRVSYLAYLRDDLKCGPKALAFYQTITHDEWGVGIDAEPALDCWGFGLPGFKGLRLAPGPIARMGYTAAGYCEGGSPTFHYPDGNASIARLLVRDLIPTAIPGLTAEDIVNARADYNKLDRTGAPIRIRLSSTVVGARNIGSLPSPRGVKVAYARGGKLHRVYASNCVLACWNMMIPYICPELPEPQKAALHQLVKVPLVYTSVGLRNWRAFHKLGIQSISAPGCYFTSMMLNWPVDIGGYRSPRSPDEPMLAFLVHVPTSPGLPERDQHRVGRAALLGTPFETYERNLRDQFARMAGHAGFDPANDITAIAVNRWPHGYAYEFNPLFDDFSIPPEKRANVVGRQRFGRIAIANSDSGAAAYTDSAIDQAHRAVNELLAS